MRIDAHQHYWSIEHRDYGWLRPTPALAAIYRDYRPADLHPLLDAAGIDATLLVQAAPTEAETSRLLALADEPGSRVAGVVGWCDFESPDAVERIERLADRPLLRGLRPMLQDLPDPQWILKPALQPAWQAMQRRALVLDGLVKGEAQLAALTTFAARWPGLRIVLDHAAKPPIAGGELRAWREGIDRIAKFPQVSCKLSGLVTEAEGDWRIDDLRPVVDHLMERFGPERLLWGSDWPVVDLAGGYGAWRRASDELLSSLPPEQRAAIEGVNAVRIYAL